MVDVEAVALDQTGKLRFRISGTDAQGGDGEQSGWVSENAASGHTLVRALSARGKKASAGGMARLARGVSARLMRRSIETVTELHDEASESDDDGAFLLLLLLHWRFIGGSPYC